MPKLSQTLECAFNFQNILFYTLLAIFFIYTKKLRGVQYRLIYID